MERCCVAKLLYSATMSLDGYISASNGDQSWLAEYLAPNPVADRLVDDIGALLVGARTYTGDDPNRGTDKEGAFSGQWHGPQIVLTHNPPAAAPADVTFCATLAEAVAAAHAAAGDKQYVNVLGASVGRQCLEAGLLHEMFVLIAPVLLGDGTPLFRRAGGRQVRLQRRDVASPRHVTNLWFDVGSESDNNK
jgi:dihydrofolate reductase